LDDDKVVGRHLKWAREQQNLTMENVEDLLGPAKGYQSEVEKGKKQEVSSKKLGEWCRALKITPAFARGQVHQLDPKAAPGRCRGLAGWVEPEVRARLAEFQAMTPPERVREVLRMIVRSPELPTVVLAYVMALEVSALLNLLYDPSTTPTEVQMRQVAILTAIPTRFYRFGELDPEE
jgi:transcriptional regulator with XRE-family HTH domain